MTRHVIVDGSNLATEGRTQPSLQQLKDAIASYKADHPDVLMTVVVDATFGHRIDPKEVPAFDKAIDSNEFVAPPAGAVGRGDGFILNIAQKADASILSNDSYQEFHGEFPWLFDEGRLIGGKPVPHVGWVWVNRVPVRGPVSRRSVKEGKTVDKQPRRRRGSGNGTSGVDNTAIVGSIDASAPMPVPKTPPPSIAAAAAAAVAAAGATAAPAAAPAAGGRGRRGEKPAAQKAPAVPPQQAPASRGASTPTNDLLPFLTFVENYPVGTAVTGVVQSYSSHGAYVAIGDVFGYVPLRLMAEPAPRSAREVMELGETVTLVVHGFGAARRSIDLAVPAMAPPPPAPAVRGRRGKAAAAADAAPQQQVIADALAAAPVEEAAAVAASTEPPPAKRGRGRKAAAPTVSDASPADAEPSGDTSTEPPPARSSRRRGSTRQTSPQAGEPESLGTGAADGAPDRAPSTPPDAVEPATARRGGRRRSGATTSADSIATDSGALAPSGTETTAAEDADPGRGPRPARGKRATKAAAPARDVALDALASALPEAPVNAVPGTPTGAVRDDSGAARPAASAATDTPVGAAAADAPGEPAPSRTRAGRAGTAKAGTAKPGTATPGAAEARTAEAGAAQAAPAKAARAKSAPAKAAPAKAARAKAAAPRARRSAASSSADTGAEEPAS